MLHVINTMRKLSHTNTMTMTATVHFVLQYLALFTCTRSVLVTNNPYETCIINVRDVTMK